MIRRCYLLALAAAITALTSTSITAGSATVSQSYYGDRNTPSLSRSSIPSSRSSTDSDAPESDVTTREVRAREQPIPLYTIDLSAPPDQRYNAICSHFREELREVSTIYQAIIDLSGFRRTVGSLARLLLRRVHSDEETQEIRGIARASGLKLNEVVAYNSFLDLFSGCVSGGTRVRGEDGVEKMLHFRGLDWEMDCLRDLLIQVEYVRDGAVVARGVTYAGYVGTLTGVREGLSISMNYRVRLTSSSSVLSHRKHQLSILLGRRPSIASQLRAHLLAPGPPTTLAQLREEFETTHASPCYLTFCSRDEVLVMEKDLKELASEAQISRDFLAVTNHDRAMEQYSQGMWTYILQRRGFELENATVARGLMESSMERKSCIVKLSDEMHGAVASVDEIKEWLRTHPVRNEDTHFSCIMDPSQEGGGILWVEACEEV